MKQLLLAALLALVASAAHAQRVNFVYTGKLLTYTVPETGLYQIVAFGAQGGSGGFENAVGVGGRGAEIGGNFSLTAGEILQIAVGSAGGGSGGGGGGDLAREQGISLRLGPTRIAKLLARGRRLSAPRG